MKGVSTIAAELNVPERVLLFCIASGTEWARAGVTGATATVMVIRGLIERNSRDDLALTKDSAAEQTGLRWLYVSISRPRMTLGNMCERSRPRACGTDIAKALKIGRASVYRVLASNG
jgi:hypothetical protein